MFIRNSKEKFSICIQHYSYFIDFTLVSMPMYYNEDLQRIHVVDLYVRTVYNRVNLLFVVCSIPIDLLEDRHHHPESTLHVFYSHLSNNYRIVVHIVYMSCNVCHQFPHLMNNVHHRAVNVIRKVQLNNHRQNQMVALEQWYESLER